MPTLPIIRKYRSHFITMKCQFTNLPSLTKPNVGCQQGLTHVADGKLENHLAIAYKVKCLCTLQTY